MIAIICGQQLPVGCCTRTPGHGGAHELRAVKPIPSPAIVLWQAGPTMLRHQEGDEQSIVTMLLGLAASYGLELPPDLQPGKTG